MAGSAAARNGIAPYIPAIAVGVIAGMVRAPDTARPRRSRNGCCKREVRHEDVIIWLMKTLLRSRCVNERGVGHECDEIDGQTPLKLPYSLLAQSCQSVPLIY